MTRSKPGLVLLLVLVFAINLAETAWESALHAGATISSSDDRGAYAVRQLEPAFVDFEFHDQTPAWMVYSSSIAYFIVFPALALAVLVALAVRPGLAPFRVLCLAVAVDYVVSLPWFLFFPVPERWAYPESSAVLLSDQWTSLLIQSIRPLSGLNNSFPSTHTSLTVILVLLSWLFDVRWRLTVTTLGTMVILATFVLGIHWVPDILAGVAAGALSVAVAWRCTDTSERPQLAELEGVSALPWKPRARLPRVVMPVGAALGGSRPIPNAPGR